ALLLLHSLFCYSRGSSESGAEFARKYGINANKHAIVLADYWRNGHYNVRSLAGLAVFLGLICTMFAFTVFCTGSILGHLSRARAISTKTRQLQYALFRSMAVQTLIPVVFLHGNAACAIVLPLFGVDYSIDFISVFCFPPLDALATILLMRDYREAVWSMATCRLSSRKS
ncbi:hypothetical protein PENTCL1PPCAC_15917, partial [Pristionchus entomophagus]